ncbi:MAG TPA: hypothetical protein VHT30_08675 [Acidimicrobiales bacterium]|nr:hypothetical protein [Acidimicrobiales bacterium]
MAIVLIWALYIRAIVGAARQPDDAYRAVGRTKAGTVIMVVLTGCIGGVYFLLRVRPQLLSAESGAADGRRPPPDAGEIKQWRRTGDPWS